MGVERSHEEFRTYGIRSGARDDGISGDRRPGIDAIGVGFAVPDDPTALLELQAARHAAGYGRCIGIGGRPCSCQLSGDACADGSDGRMRATGATGGTARSGTG